MGCVVMRDLPDTAAVALSLRGRDARRAFAPRDSLGRNGTHRLQCVECVVGVSPFRASDPALGATPGHPNGETKVPSAPHAAPTGARD